MATGLAGHFVAMARNNAWANHRLLGACEALTAGAFAAPRTGFFPSLRATLNHILDVDLYYVTALEGGDAPRRYDEPASAYPDARSLRPVQAALDKRLIAFCEGQTEDSLSRDCTLPRPGRKPPQLDEFFLAGEQHLRRDELRAVGLPEA
jgi:uncharacterized damage-inducible protein DinB